VKSKNRGKACPEPVEWDKGKSEKETGDKRQGDKGKRIKEKVESEAWGTIQED
jgi:hypothetical protein